MEIIRYAIRIFQRGAAAWAPGGQLECPFCDRTVRRFLPYRIGRKGLPSLSVALKIVGSDVDNFSCPRCSSHDRERHLLFYLRASGLLDLLPNMRILHFAPERRLQHVIEAARPSEYVRADLNPASTNIRRVDIQDMPFKDASFDIAIANHVMEHVTDDIKALSEIHRVLRSGGHAILQTPFSSKLMNTWQDPGIDTDEARLEAFGQEDHVRLYGRDIIGRFESVGFTSFVSSHQEILPDIDGVRFGVNTKEPFFLFRKLDFLRNKNQPGFSEDVSP